ncbi:hypothetical protein ACIPPN_21205 [Streptomyces diastaticus]|uniref:hypothetical protein n=1 Tax=Streptomyces TaxID=1883 RepID=UPI001374E531|nr:hypothetical protein [Streptomyces sp. TSRI0384-2]NEE38481.1 hypothetical protein [Streptomyces sp. SID7982]
MLRTDDPGTLAAVRELPDGSLEAERGAGEVDLAGLADLCPSFFLSEQSCARPSW